MHQKALILRRYNQQKLPSIHHTRQNYNIVAKLVSVEVEEAKIIDEFLVSMSEDRRYSTTVKSFQVQQRNKTIAQTTLSKKYRKQILKYNHTQLMRILDHQGPLRIKRIHMTNQETRKVILPHLANKNIH